MKNLIKIFVIVFLFSGSAFAQSAPVLTTLSAALASGSSSTAVTVGSNTGITATGMSCLIDHEIVNPTAVSGSTGLTVNRAIRGNAVTHPSGAIVICGPRSGTFNPANGQTTGVFLSSPPTGSCTAANSQYLPVIVTGSSDPKSWQMSNCNNGRWVDQTLPNDEGDSITQYCTTPGILQGFTLLTSFTSAAAYTMGTNQTPVDGTVYYGTVFLPKTTVIDSISALNGTVAGTNALLYGLYRADGVRLANTATAGTTASGANRFQSISLTADFLATGPARYWVSVSTNGTTTRLTTVPAPVGAGTGNFMGLLGSSATGTFGTLAALTLPTALIANTAPVACLVIN